MIQTSDNVDKLFVAIHAAQGAMRGATKDSKNPAFKSSYASLESVIDTARPALQSANLAFTQAPGALVDGAIEITTMLMHTSGQWLRSTLHVPLSKRDPQGVGSAITYGCRYTLMATLGLPPVDDDGEAAMDRTPPLKAGYSPPPKAPPPAATDSPALATITAALKLCATAEALDDWCNADTNKVAFNALSDADYDTLNSRIIRWREHVAKVAA
jgi:hypothetical protein